MTPGANQNHTFFSAKLADGEKVLRVLIFRFTPLGFSFYAPLPQARAWNTITSHKIVIDLPDQTHMTVEALMSQWKEADVPGIGKCLVGEASIVQKSANKSSSKNQRKTQRLEISTRQPRCIVSHPLIPNMTLEFKVSDLSAQGMNLTAPTQVHPLFPQFIFNGHLLFPDNTSIQVRFVVKYSNFDEASQTLSVGTQFLSPSIELLSTISRKLLSIYNMDATELQKARLCFVVPRPKQTSKPMKPAPAPNHMVRTINTLDEWHNVLQFRLSTLRYAGLVNEKTDIRMLMSTRDAIGSHIAAFFEDGKMAASATLIPVTKFGSEQRAGLPYFVHIENAPERFLDFSQYFTTAQKDPQTALESLVKYAVEIAQQQKISCVVTVVPNEWFDLFERISTIPHVVERATATQGSPSVFYFLVGEAGERFIQSVHRKEFQSHENEATFSRVFRTFIEKKD